MEARDHFFIPEQQGCSRRRITVGADLEPKATITRYTVNVLDLGATARTPEGNFVMACVHLKEVRVRDTVFRNGAPIRIGPTVSGSIFLFDWRESWFAELTTESDTVTVVMSHSYLSEVANDSRPFDFGGFHGGIVPSYVDRTFLHLIQALLPMLDGHLPVTQLFVDHVAAAIGTYICIKYSIVRNAYRVTGRLSFRQETRAKEFLRSHLDGNVALADVAGICGLSAQHFARAFKRSTGVSPYRWLLLERVQQAKSLLEIADISTAEIAVKCGFADQSHLTRTFSRFVGTTPGMWRRTRRCN